MEKNILIRFVGNFVVNSMTNVQSDLWSILDPCSDVTCRVIYPHFSLFQTPRKYLFPGASELKFAFKTFWILVVYILYVYSYLGICSNKLYPKVCTYSTQGSVIFLYLFVRLFATLFLIHENK